MRGNWETGKWESERSSYNERIIVNIFHSSTFFLLSTPFFVLEIFLYKLNQNLKHFFVSSFKIFLFFVRGKILLIYFLLIKFFCVFSRQFFLQYFVCEFPRVFPLKKGWRKKIDFGFLFVHFPAVVSATKWTFHGLDIGWRGKWTVEGKSIFLLLDFLLDFLNF